MAKVKEKRDEDGRIIIDSWDEVPQFKTEAEEQTWWDEHTIGETLVERFKPVSDLDRSEVPLPPARQLTRSKSVTVRFEMDVIKRLKSVAEKKQMGYQTLLKEFVLERLYEEEKREGVV